MRPLPSIVLSALIASAAPARAEDFTGFYAGLNAGYTQGRDRETQDVAPGAGASAGAAQAGLPPSALSASERFEEKRPTGRRVGAR